MLLSSCKKKKAYYKNISHYIFVALIKLKKKTKTFPVKLILFKLNKHKNIKIIWMCDSYEYNLPLILNFKV